jgi:hypothetical protein
MDPNECTDCSSNLDSPIVFLSSSNGQCTPDTSDATYPNLQLVQIVNKNTILGTSYLKNVTIGTDTYAVSGTTIGNLFFF